MIYINYFLGRQLAVFFVLADASGVRGLETMEAEHVTDGSRKTENMLQRHVMHSIPAV